MSNSGEYLTKIMEIESVSKQELASLTGKKEGTIASWIRFNDPVVPKYNDLVIICQRLGISIDDYYNQTILCNLLDISENLYAPYLSEDGDILIQHLSYELFSNSNYKDILNSYINDMQHFKDMYNAGLKGESIDQNVFNRLCMNLHIYYQMEEEIPLMHYNYLENYRLYLKDAEEYELPTKPTDCYILIRPENHYMFLLDRVDIDITKRYIECLFPDELSDFVRMYIKKIENDKSYDNKNVILKTLLRCHADVLNSEDVKDYDMLYKLISRML